MTKEQYINNVCLQLLREEMKNPRMMAEESRAYPALKMYMEIYLHLPDAFNMTKALWFAKDRLGINRYQIATPKSFSKVFRKFFTECPEKGFYHDETN